MQGSPGDAKHVGHVICERGAFLYLLPWYMVRLEMRNMSCIAPLLPTRLVLLASFFSFPVLQIEFLILLTY